MEFSIANSSLFRCTRLKAKTFTLTESIWLDTTVVISSNVKLSSRLFWCVKMNLFRLMIPEFSWSDWIHVASKIAIRPAIGAILYRLLQVLDELPGSPRIARMGVQSLDKIVWIRKVHICWVFSPEEGTMGCSWTCLQPSWSHTPACSWRRCSFCRSPGCPHQRRSSSEHLDQYLEGL